MEYAFCPFCGCKPEDKNSHGPGCPVPYYPEESTESAEPPPKFISFVGRKYAWNVDTISRYEVIDNYRNHDGTFTLYVGVDFADGKHDGVKGDDARKFLAFMEGRVK